MAPRTQAPEDGPEQRLALQHAWSQLLESADTIADSITLSLFERDAEIYQRIGPELRAEVRASSREHIRRGLHILSGRAPRPATAINLWRDTGRRRARQGVPLEAVLHAYTLGARVLWEALVERAEGSTGTRIDDQVLLVAASMVWSNLDLQSAVLIDAYRRESARMQRRDLQRHHVVLDALLAGRADPAFLDDARDTLGVAVDDDLACMVVLHDRDSADHLGEVEDRLEKSGIEVRWHVRTGVHVALLSGDLPDDGALAATLTPHVPARVGLARSTGGLGGFATAHLLATRAAETLDRHERRAVCVGDRLPEVLLVGSPQVAPLLVEQTLGPVLVQPDAQRRTLLQTLEALLRHDGSPTHAAADLFCHRNTVIYRLKQIESLTGRSVADPRDKLLLGLAMAALRSSGPVTST